MVLPVGDQAAEEVRAAQEGTVLGRGAAEGHVIAAAGTGVASVDHELLGRQPAEPRGLEQRLGAVHDLLEARRRVHVDLDDAGVRREPERLQPSVVRRFVALDDGAHAGPVRRRLDRGHQPHPGGDPAQRRQEDVDVAAAVLDAQRRAHEMVVGDVGTATASATAGFGVAVRVAVRAVAEQRRQRLPGREVVLRHRAGLGVDRLLLRQRVERQPKARRRVARHEEDLAAAHRPGARAPALPVAFERQQPGGGLVEAFGELLDETCARTAVLEIELVERLRLGEERLEMKVVQRVLVQGAEQIVLEPEPCGQRAGEAFGVGGGVLALAGQGEGGGVAHDRLTVVAPVADQRPARRRLAGVPLALGEGGHAVRGPGFAQPSEQVDGALQLVLAEGGAVPLRTLAVVDRDEGRLAAHRQRRTSSCAASSLGPPRRPSACRCARHVDGSA